MPSERTSLPSSAGPASAVKRPASSTGESSSSPYLSPVCAYVNIAYIYIYIYIYAIFTYAQTGLKYGLELLSPVDDAGRFTAEAGPALEGKDVLSDGNQAIYIYI